jgi:hypothetical protein
MILFEGRNTKAGTVFALFSMLELDTMEPSQPNFDVIDSSENGKEGVFM